jgi:DNA-binding transcriptional MerR regulator
MAEPAVHNQPSRRRGKSEAAFRTISEVASDLDLPQHVLRFWETKFVQVRPMKRGGGRRYYRPEDVLLLKRIRDLLYDDGYTIKGVQKLLKHNGGKPPGSIPPGMPEESLELTAELPDESDTLLPSSDLPAPAMSAAQRRELSVLLTELEELREILTKNMR